MEVIQPRPYQTLAVNAAIEGLAGVNQAALIVLATGLGKTITAALIAKKFKAAKVLFLVHNNFILEHAMSEFKKVIGIEKSMAIFNGISKRGVGGANFIFSTWQTMGKNLKLWRSDHFDLVIVDEAHHAGAKTYEPVLKYFSSPKLGITATPDRGDGYDIRNIFGSEMINVTLEEAIVKGWLPKIEYRLMLDETLDDRALQLITAEIQTAKKRFSMAELNRRLFIKKRDRDIAQIIGSEAEKAIVFCANIRHANRMSRALTESRVFHSSVGQSQLKTWKINQKTLQALGDGTIRRVCSVNAFNEGVDVPSVGLVAFCRVTSSLTIFRQQLGRGLRPGKDKLIVLDFVGNLERIQVVLEMLNRIKRLKKNFLGKSTGDSSRTGAGQLFEVSGRGFAFTFSKKVIDLIRILERAKQDFYPTWQEAGAAAHALGLRTQMQYNAGYKVDPKLPSVPNKVYVDFPGFSMFLRGVGKKGKYSTWQEASMAAKGLGIQSGRSYAIRYVEDPLLPRNPNEAYADFPGFPTFLGVRDKTDKYPTWQEAAIAARKLGLEGKAGYKAGYKGDTKLPHHPERYYGESFPGWVLFLTGDLKETYGTWCEAAAAAKRCGIKTVTQYPKLYKNDPKLPSAPDQKYADWPGWPKFFGRDERATYATCALAMQSAKKYNFKNKADYQKRCRKVDPMLPVTANVKYGDFPGWDVFLGLNE